MKEFLLNLPNFFSSVELFFLETTTAYFLINYFNVVILFYSLLYFFSVILLLVLYLFFLQVDLFALFLLMSELIIFFVSLLLVFNLSSQGEKIVKKDGRISLIGFFVLFVIISSSYIYGNECEFYLPYLFLDFQIWDNYYEALQNTANNDLFSVFFVLYYNYSPFLVSIGYILFIGSLVCVNLNKIFLKMNTKNYANIFDAHEFLSTITDAVFLRKQNLNEQTTHETSTKEFKKK